MRRRRPDRLLGNAERDQLDPILDACVAIYKENLDKDGQVEFKGKVKAFVHVRLSVIGPALLECELGEAVDLPQLPDPQVASPERGGSRGRPPRNHRHGQLSGREARRHANRPR
jgi:hypothetical protein